MGCSRRRRNENAVTDRDTSPLPGHEIDSEFLVADGGAQRCRQIEIATAVFGVDVGGAAAAVAAVDPKQPATDLDIAADPIEFLPGPGAVDIEIGAKAQRVDLVA